MQIREKITLNWIDETLLEEIAIAGRRLDNMTQSPELPVRNCIEFLIFSKKLKRSKTRKNRAPRKSKLKSLMKAMKINK